MTDKRILIEIPDYEDGKELEKRFQKGVQCIFYTKDYLTAQEIDLDNGTVIDIKQEYKKIIFTPRKDSLNFDYELSKQDD